MSTGGTFEDKADYRLEEAVRWRLRLAEAGLDTAPEFEAANQTRQPRCVESAVWAVAQSG